MDRPHLNSNGDLISLHRLEFYKKKMNWKLSHEYRPRNADTADTADTEPKVGKEPRPNGNKFLNSTYTLVEDPEGHGSGDFNVAFCESDLDNSESPQQSNNSTSKSKRSSIRSKTNQPRYSIQYKHKNVTSNTERKYSGHINRAPYKPFSSGRDQKFTKDGKEISMPIQNCSRGSDVLSQSLAQPVGWQQSSGTSQEFSQPNIIGNQKLEKWSEKIYAPQQARSCPHLENTTSQNLLEKALDIPHKICNTPPEINQIAYNPNFLMYEQLTCQPTTSNQQFIVPQICSDQCIETNNCQNYYYYQQRCVKIQTYYQTYYQTNPVYNPNLSEYTQRSYLNSAERNMLPNLSHPREMEHFEQPELNNYCVWSNPPYEAWSPGEEAMPNAAYLSHNMTPLQTPLQPAFVQSTNPRPPIYSVEDQLNMHESVNIPPGFEVMSCESEEEFITGAKLVPHSSELESNVDDAEEPLAPERPATTQLAGEVGRHTAALRNLALAAARQPSRSLHSFNEYGSERIPLVDSPSYEELPTRDIGLFVATDYIQCDDSTSVTSEDFVGESFKNNADLSDELFAAVGRGRGRGRLNASNIDCVTKLGRPY